MTLEENLDSVLPMMRVYVAAVDKLGFEKLLIDGVFACEVADASIHSDCPWIMGSQVLEFIEYPLPDGTGALRFRIEGC